MSTPPTPPTPARLSSDRLVLRALTSADVEAFVAYRSDPDTLRWLGSRVAPTHDTARASIESMRALGGPTPGQWYRYGIEHDGALVGDASAVIRGRGGTAEIGYVLHPAARGRGLASEATGALIDHLIAAHDIVRIEASLSVDNVASMRVLESVGMTYECIARQGFDLDGSFDDNLRYAMTADERAAWVARPRHRPNRVELVEINCDNSYQVHDLRTHYSEQRFVAPMAETWVDALFPESFEAVTAVPWMRAIAADGEIAGFVMCSTTHGSREGWYLWRLLIDRRHQRRGIATKALDALRHELTARGVARLYTSYVEGPGTPRPFYLGFGFTPTGRDVDGETELVLDLA